MRIAFNEKQGIETGQVYVHPRIYGKEPLVSGPLKGRNVPIQGLVSKILNKLSVSKE